MTVTPDELGTYLGVTIAADDPRGTLILTQAAALCLSVVDPLPAGSDAVILDVAARAYGNPGNVQQQATGPFSASYGPVGGGLWLTRQNKTTLRRLAGGGGAFTIDTMPATAGQNLPWWDSSNLYSGTGTSDFDSPP